MMFEMRTSSLLAVVLVAFPSCLAGMESGSAGANVKRPGALTVRGVCLIPDERISNAYARYFWEGWSWRDEHGKRIQYFPQYYAPGAYVHMILQNTSQKDVSIVDVLLNGVSLEKGLAKGAIITTGRAEGEGDLTPRSIYYLPQNDPDRKKLEEAGTPVWYRAIPSPVLKSSESVQLTIRLRRMPKIAEIDIAVIDSGNHVAKTTAKVAPPDVKIAYIGFGKNGGTLYLYLKALSKQRIGIGDILLDGQTVPASMIHAPEKRFGQIIPVVVRLAEPLTFGSYHLLEIDCHAGGNQQPTRLAQVFRARDDMFPISMLMNPTDKGQVGLPDSATMADAFAKYCKELHQHGVNYIRWFHPGSIGCDEVLTDEGQQIAKQYGIKVDLVVTKAMLESDFLEKHDSNPVIWQWYFFDEPDIFDFSAKGIPVPDRSGVVTMSLIQRDARTRALSKQKLTTFHIDGTFKPENWFNFGQISDFPTTGFYWPSALSLLHAVGGDGNPRRFTLRDVYALSVVANKAISPTPFGFILLGYDESGYMPAFYRAAAPQEQRLAVYYCVAGGAKQVGYYGYRAEAGLAGNRELFDYIGLVHAELSTIGALLETGYPVSLTGPATEKTDGVMTATILRGLDTAVVLLINERYTSDLDSFSYSPLHNVYVRISLPKWLKPKHVIEITYDGPKKITKFDTTHLPGSTILSLDFEELDLTKAIVVTCDPTLLKQLKDVYDEGIRDRVTELKKLVKRR